MAERARLLRGRELEHVGAVVEGQDHAPVAAEQAAQPGRHGERHAAPLLGRRRRHGDAAEARPALRPMGDRLLGAADQLDRREIGLLHRGAPADGPVLLEQDGARLGMRLEGLGHLLGDGEARAQIGERDDVAAVDLSEHLGAAVVVGERDDRVGMRVDDRVGGEEAVERRLDGRPRARGLEQGVREVVDHHLVVHVRALEEGPDVVDHDAGEVLLLDALQIGAAALDAEHPHLAAAVIALGALDRRVPAAPDDERGLGADQARGVHEQIEIGEALRRGVVPA